MEERELTIQDIFEVFIKRWKSIFIPSIIAAIITGIILFILPNTYESYALLKIGKEANNNFESIETTEAIFTSKPTLEQIAKILNEEPTKDFLKYLHDTIRFRKNAGLLLISARAKSPENAKQIVEVVVNLVNERHTNIYNSSLTKLDRVVNYVKKTIQPIPLSSGINEFKIEPTKIEVPPLLIKDPIRKNKITKILIAFFVVFFISTMLAFYKQERKEYDK